MMTDKKKRSEAIASAMLPGADTEGLPKLLARMGLASSLVDLKLDHTDGDRAKKTLKTGIQPWLIFASSSLSASPQDSSRSRGGISQGFASLLGPSTRLPAGHLQRLAIQQSAVGPVVHYAVGGGEILVERYSTMGAETLNGTNIREPRGIAVGLFEFHTDGELQRELLLVRIKDVRADALTVELRRGKDEDQQGSALESFEINSELLVVGAVSRPRKNILIKRKGALKL